MLPLVPTHEADRSPYNALSAMAGSPELISGELRAERGLTDPDDLTPTQRADFEDWCEQHADWLEPYVEFMALRDAARPRALADLGAAPARPGPAARRGGRSMPIGCRHCGSTSGCSPPSGPSSGRTPPSKGVLIFGDLPIFVSHDSADVWASRDLFELDAEGRPITVTGVPPDYFAVDGQRWNNPHYDWAAMAADGFAWWRLRIARQRELFDLVRIDHFRGFEAAWHVPVEAPSARDGSWVPGPGRELLAALVETAGPGTLVAEDLGVITPAVEQLRLGFGLPGMKVLQFAFDGGSDNAYLPEHHGELSVVYTGTHDNDTTLGWWSGLDARDPSAGPVRGAGR